jgi:hypothetical protein
MCGVTKKNVILSLIIIASQIPSKGTIFSCDKDPHTRAFWHISFREVIKIRWCEKKWMTYGYAPVLGPKGGLSFVLTTGQCSVVVVGRIALVNLNV